MKYKLRTEHMKSRTDFDIAVSPSKSNCLPYKRETPRGGDLWQKVSGLIALHVDDEQAMRSAL
jgi:hypothetical protein